MQMPPKRVSRKIKVLPLVIILIVTVSVAALFILGVYDVFFGKKSYPVKYTDEIRLASETYGVDEYIIYSTIFCESGFDKDAVSGMNAKGLMQLLPETYEWLSDDVATDENIFDPEKNILFGTKYLSILYSHYESLLKDDSFYKNCDVWDVVHAAYHAGNGRVDKWLEEGTVIIDSNGNISELPIKTTKVYIDRINEAKSAYIKIIDTKEKNDGLQGA